MLQALISFWLLAIQPSNDAIPSITKGTKYIKPFKIMLGRYPVTIEFKPGLQDNRKITYGIILIALSANWIIILIRSFWHLHKVHSSRRWNCMTFVCKVVSVIMLSFLKPLWELHDWITITWNFIFLEHGTCLPCSSWWVTVFHHCFSKELKVISHCPLNISL